MMKQDLRLTPEFTAHLLTKSVLTGLCFVLLLAGLATAQTTKQPTPQKAASVPAAPGADAANRDVTGMYTFVQEGEFVQITVETYPPAGSKSGAVVTGFVSRMGDLESDKGAYLDQFFSQGSFIGDKLTFTTKTVHGVSYEFHGKVERGPGKVKAEEGFYIIRGTLKRSSEDVNKKTSSQSREITFKSFPDLDTDEAVFRR